ncbi:LLM class flavin-dependent oxidoreductase [Nonomuraea endophytica]|uniref:Alkanesulfonate monooxygenase SsuD/methylene tetrahydromethanopterin reductase-like flavin-dependent oxidoreductase (Luciferase family) n=1 Tax=Nonomuraea endophytica TaxID=714136 RepID=A0A7W8ENA2_9ACTN|nr:LLM class flavin-dependent oxidoreductase [Nonomuraea endophytica]MBB5085223.1 alkanesulfonate monooxygenase SsuD/methylene tetrahydromethanopterin reductase-like flavin-dependent oxidoreductase (luciferase family) [Nonomuraea endophytica]
MRYGIDIAILGDLAEPARLVTLAQEAEAAGWEAVLVWDHLAFAWGTPSADPWVALAAAAQATSRVKLGTAVTAVAGHRPERLAQTLATLDRLSGGRVILGAGLGGVKEEFTAFGSARPGGAVLDEALGVLDALWSGDEVRHRGAHFTVDGVRLAPLPVQRPRIPVWVGGTAPAALRRAARWDGWIVAADDQEGRMSLTPEALADQAGELRRAGAGALDVAVIGVSEPGESVRAYAEAGATWWLEHLHGYRGSMERLVERVKAGPPG